jgi:hypothetical protein
VRRGGGSGCAGRTSGAVFGEERLGADLVDRPLEPRLGLVVAVADPVEHPDHGVGGLEDLAGGNEFLDRERAAPQGRQPTAGEHPEPDLLAAPGRGALAGEKAQVVDERLRAIGATAAADRRFELARQGRRVRPAQQVASERLDVGRRIERLVLGDAGERAARPVAHRVAAGLLGGDPGIGEPAQRRLGVGQRHEVILDVLPGRDVALAAAVDLGDITERQELRRGDEAAGQLGADHHDAVLALTVDAVQQAEPAPVVGGKLAVLERFEPFDEQVNVCFAGEAKAAWCDRRNIDDAHSDLSASGAEWT